MAIDIRATCTCSLGTLISASISDDYIQGSGLIKVRGQCVIQGVITPDVGTIVTFAYTKSGVTTTLPRKLRVLSSFADPFRQTTTVELGCKLTYLQDLKDPIRWEWFDDDENNDYTEDDSKIIIIPIHASSVMSKCLTELGLTASSSPLTNKFSIPEFDFSPGYVQVLSDLLVSESYCGYLDTNEVLQILSLNQEGGTGPVLDNTKIIDLGPVGFGQLPGESVVVSYSTLKLKAPDQSTTPSVLWERDETYGPIATYTVKYGNNQEVTYTGRDVTVVERTYERLTLATAVGVGNWFYYQATGEVRDVLVKEVTTVTSPSIAGEESYASQLLTNGLFYNNSDVVASKTVRTIEYYRSTGEPSKEIVEESMATSAAWGSLSVPLVYSSTDYLIPGYELIPTRRIETTYEQAPEFTKRVTSEYLWQPFFQRGQQGAAEAGQIFTSAMQALSYFYSITSQLTHAGTTIETTRVGTASYEGRPNGSSLLAARYAEGGKPANGYRTESKAELELALGSAEAQRRIEFQMPYAPDDVFVGSYGGFYSVKSDAEAKANLYGRVQNKLLLGNRNGMNVQVAPSVLPTTPFAPVFVSASGYVALYRTNGTSYTMDANGIVASSDLLFMGGVGTV